MALCDVRGPYRMLAPALAEAGYRVADMDVRGYGRSSLDWSSYENPAVGGDVLALIRELGGPATVIGHSIGCAGAVWAAADLAAAPATIAMIEESGHYPHLDRPQETAAVVLKFLAGA